MIQVVWFNYFDCVKYVFIQTWCTNICMMQILKIFPDQLFEKIDQWKCNAFKPDYGSWGKCPL